jgi:general secretion pathway protein D
VIIVPDTRTNSLILTTAPRNYDILLPILEDLDKAPAQVLIQVLLAEVTLDKSLDLGLKFATWDAIGYDRDATLREFGAGGTTLFYSLINKNLAGFLNFLQTSGKLDVLGRPQILASDNQPAQINVGQQAPYPVSVTITSGGNVITGVQYATLGIILTVTPHINPAGSVNMVISAENSSISQSTLTISQGVQAAVFNQELATTTVAIQDGETIVIGGLIQNTSNKQVSKMPILGDIPILGDLFFKVVANKDQKRELLVILTPRVVRSKEQLAKLSAEEEARTKNLPNVNVIELASPPSPAQIQKPSK